MFVRTKKKARKKGSATTARGFIKIYIHEIIMRKVDENGKPTYDKSRPLSWSAISAFEYDKEQWYNKYVLGRPDPVTEEMLFGSKIGKQIEKDINFLPEIPRARQMEYKFEAVYEGIKLVGFADSFGFDELVLHEYKTGVKPWDQKRADDHGQITMYLFMLYLVDGIDPATVECNLHWMPTVRKQKYEKGTGDLKVSIDFLEPFKVHSFRTKRIKRDVMEFGMRINKTIKAMDEYCKNHE